MNKLIFLFAITFSVVCHGQTIPKNTNAITITGDFTRSEKIDQIADTFLDSGVIIASIDRELGSITTSPKSFKNGTVTLHVVVRDGKVTIRGNWQSDVVVSLYGVTSNPNDIQPVSYGGMQGSPKRNAWDAFHSIVEKIPGDKEYVVEK